MKNSYSDLELTAVPIDKKTAVVAFSKGESFSPKIIDHRVLDGRTSPKSTNYPLKKFDGITFREDFTGKRYGRLTVIWLHHIGRRSDKWVVRCDCGKYELRKPEKLETLIKAGASLADEMCDFCKIANQDRLAKKHKFDRTTPKATCDSARILVWIDHMRKDGYTESEIEFIFRVGYFFRNNPTIEQVRKDLLEQYNFKA